MTYILLYSISDVSGWWVADNERLCEMELSLKLKRFKQVSKTWPQGDKKIFMLNWAEHEIINAHKYKNIEKDSFFHAQISLDWYFSYP